MSRFTVEETNLMCIYSTCSRTELLSELTEMQQHLADDETELKTLTTSVIEKLTDMSDEDFDSIANELVMDFE